MAQASLSWAALSPDCSNTDDDGKDCFVSSTVLTERSRLVYSLGMIELTRTRDVDEGALLPLVRSAGWTFSAIAAESRRLGKPLAPAVLSRINRGVTPLSEAHAQTLAQILGADPVALVNAVNAGVAA